MQPPQSQVEQRSTRPQHAEGCNDYLALAGQDGGVELAGGLLALRDVHEVGDGAAARVLKRQQRHRALCTRYVMWHLLLYNV